jgi:hypothetical protein
MDVPPGMRAEAAMQTIFAATPPSGVQGHSTSGGPLSYDPVAAVPLRVRSPTSGNTAMAARSSSRESTE